MPLSKTLLDHGWAYMGVCPETGLNIFRKPEWTRLGFGKNYRVTLSIVGDHILWVQTSGYATRHDIIQASKLTAQAVAEAFYGGRRYFHIVDLRDYQGISFGARKYYIAEMMKRKQMAAMVFCHASPIARISINLGKRLSIINIPVYMVTDFGQAAQLVQRIRKTEENAKSPPMVLLRNAQIPTDGSPPDSKPTCPVTSLPITKKPHWTRIRLDTKFSISYHLIGDAILYATLEGTSTKTGILRLIEERERVLMEAGLSGNPYVEIIDYGLFVGYPSKETRIMTADFLLNEVRKGDLRGVWVVNAITLIRWMYNVGVKIYRKTAFVHMVGNYGEALEQAVTLLQNHGAHVGNPQYTRFTKDDWCIELDDWGTCFELIGDDIIHTVDRGIYREDYIGRTFALHDKVMEETGLTEKGYYYRVFNLEKFKKTTWKARKMFLDAARESQRKVPCRFSVLYGMNRFMSKIISFSRQFAPVPVATAHSFEEAMAIIERIRQNEPGTKGLGKIRRWKERRNEAGSQRYSDELLQFMGRINWDRDGIGLEEVSDSHPFKSVFDALSIIKEDVDQLFRERKQSEERYRTILENIEDGYFEVDLKGNLTFFNDALAHITGFSHDRLVGKNYRDYTDEETALKVYRAYSGIYETGEPVKGLEYAIHVKGMEKFIETSVSMMRDGKGQPCGFRGILRDVTERKRAEQEILKYSRELESMVERRTESLQRSEEKYRTILENIEDGYYELDLRGNLTFFNDATTKITGYPEAELRGMNYRKFTDEKDSQRQYEEYNRVYHTDVPVKRFEWKVIRQDGTERIIEASISLINGPEGRPVGFRGILRDVSERKALEHQLMEKSRLAEDANRAKSEFLANLSHEIRTPLNGIIGMAELVLDTRLDPDQNNIFQTINTEANALLMLINEILDFSKIEAGKVELEEIPFDLRHAIEDAANGLAYRAEQKGLDFNAFLSPDIPSQLIGDPGRLRQILINLTGNALKFTDEGEVYLSGELAEDLGERVKIRFSIKDTGIGIPEDKQATIFESFRQADGSTTRKYGGTGLGATISKQLVEMMGGEIDLESQEGKGSIFRFTAVFKKQVEDQPVSMVGKPDLAGLRVPVVDDNRTNRFIQAEDPSSDMPATRHGMADANRKSFRILLVEDYPTNQMVAMRHLSRAGHQVDLAENGEQAVTAFKKKHYDLILMDIQMPLMDGYEATKAIRALESHGIRENSQQPPDESEKVPIIAMTAHAIAGNWEKCLTVGMNDFLSKPLRREKLLAMVEKWGLVI